MDFCMETGTFAAMQNLLDRIAVDPAIMMGKPCIKGTRVTVEHIMTELAGGMSAEDLLVQYPHLTDKDLRAAFAYAAAGLSQEDVFESAAQ